MPPGLVGDGPPPYEETSPTPHFFSPAPPPPRAIKNTTTATTTPSSLPGRGPRPLRRPAARHPIHPPRVGRPLGL